MEEDKLITVQSINISKIIKSLMEYNMERESMRDSKKNYQSIKEYAICKLKKNFDLDLSSCKEPYQKAILNYEPDSIPSFLSQQFNQQNQVVKEIKTDDLTTERIFYYNFLKLCFETDLKRAQTFLGKIEEIFQTDGFEIMFPDYKDSRFYNTTQFQKLIYQFLNKISDAQFTVQQGLVIYPIMDEALTYFFYSVSQVMGTKYNWQKNGQGQLQDCEESENKWKDFIVLLSKIFQIEVTIFQEGAYFSDTDMWIYEENGQNGSRFFVIEKSKSIQKSQYCFSKAVFDCEGEEQKQNNKMVSQIEINGLYCAQNCQSEQFLDNSRSFQKPTQSENEQRVELNDQLCEKQQNQIQKGQKLQENQQGENNYSFINEATGIANKQTQIPRQELVQSENQLYLVSCVIQGQMASEQKSVKQFDKQIAEQEQQQTEKVQKIQKLQALLAGEKNNNSKITIHSRQDQHKLASKPSQVKKQQEMIHLNQLLKLKSQIKQKDKAKKRKIKVIYKQILNQYFPPLMKKQDINQKCSQISQQKKLFNVISGAETMDTKSKASETNSGKDSMNKGNFTFYDTFSSVNSNQIKTLSLFSSQGKHQNKQNAIPKQASKVNCAQAKNQVANKNQQLSVFKASKAIESDQINIEFNNSSFAKFLRPTNQLYLEQIKHRTREMRKVINRYRMIA